MKTNLTAQYVDEHSGDIHTYESFGRGVIAAIIGSAREALASKVDADSVDFDAQVSITPFTALGCLRICINTPLGRICFHKNI